MRLEEEDVPEPTGRYKRIRTTIIGKNGKPKRVLIPNRQSTWAGKEHPLSGEKGRAHFERIKAIPRKRVGRFVGVPNGWSKDAFEAHMKETAPLADEALAILRSEEEVQAHLPSNDDDAAQAALKYATTVVLAKAHAPGTRLKAADIVLKYTKGQKVKADLAIPEAENLLEAALARRAKQSG